MKSEKEFLYKEITGKIIEAAHQVHNTIGCGFLEKIYENSLIRELELNDLEISSQKEFRVVYKEHEVGIYYADLVVDSKVIVEVKAVEKISDVHRAQIINYLKISGVRVGMLINFSRTALEYERFVV